MADPPFSGVARKAKGSPAPRRPYFFLESFFGFFFSFL